VPFESERARPSVSPNHARIVLQTELNLEPGISGRDDMGLQ